MKLRYIGLILGPLLFLTILQLPHPEEMQPAAWKVIAVAVFMLCWWITEAVPLPVTALLPMVLLPLLEVKTMEAAAAPYASPIVFLFMGGFMLALAMERWNLHRRIALGIVRITGTNANGIILGFMLATAFLSMWISNTATTVMMLPIAVSVIDLLTKDNTHLPRQNVRFFALSMMLGIAYAANIGGTATIIGTPPNVVFAGVLRKNYDIEISFAKWFIMGLPFAATLLTLTYFFLVRVLYRNNLGEFPGARELIERELKKLGRPSVGEQRTLIVFAVTAFCWIFRSPINNLFGLNLSDYLIAVLATIILFIVPVDTKKGDFLLRWEDTQRLPWGILLLFGGGLSLAGALKDTGLIDLIGSQFNELQGVGLLVILGLTAVSLFLTEVMSNVALVAVFVPVVAGVAVGMGISPVQMCIPVTLAASCAFMLPMSTPPNAIVFASGHVTVSQMVRAGFFLNIASILLIALLSAFVIPLLFS